MEHPNTVGIDFNMVNVVQTLQHIMRWIIEHAGSCMVAGALKEHLIGDAIMKVLTRMDLVTNIDAAILRVIKDLSLIHI